MSFYENMAGVALDKIAQFGVTLTINRYDETTVDPITGAASRTLLSTGTLAALILPASGGTVQAFDNRLMDSQQLQQSNLRFIMAAAKGAPFEPRPLDELEIDGATWAVMGCTPLSPAGVPLLYKMGARLR